MSILKKTIKNNILFIIGTFLLIYKALLLNYILEINIDNIEIFLFLIAISSLIMSPLINKRNKFGYIYLNVIYAIVTVIIYSDFIYYIYATNFLSLYQIVNFKNIREIGVGIVTISNIKYILLFWFDNVILALSSVWAYKKLNHTSDHNGKLKNVFILIILLINILIVKFRINNIYKEFVYNKTLIVQNSSIYYYHYEDTKDYLFSIFTNKEVNEQKLKQVYKENKNEKVDKTKYTGLAKDANVIILQLESLNEYIIGKCVNGKEITPNLNKFFEENIYCKDMYNQGLGTTADSEFEMENSMYPLENGYIFQKYSNNKWFDIFSQLKNNGYYTSFMHPNTSTYWNREEVYKIGYNIDEYNDINNFPNIEKAGGFYSDEGFFNQAIDIMNSYEGKFCTNLVSVTTHIPFLLTGVSNIENKTTLTQDDVSKYEDGIFRNYLISCNFVDYAFGNFLKRLEETGLMEKSILIVYGDHGAGISNSKVIEKLYEENELKYTSFDNTTKDIHIPFGIKIPGVEENEDIQRVVAKIDIKPTILDLLGVEDKFSLGSSIFSEKDYSFIKGLGFVTSKNYCFNGRYFNRENFQRTDETEELKILLQKMNDEIYLSDTIVKNNLFEK